MNFREKICFEKKAIQLLLTSLGILYLALISSLHLPWSYDEYGALVSHLEIDDYLYFKEYKIIFHSICTNCGSLDFFLEYILLPIFVVPLRWTYAIGISPLLDVVRWVPLDWPLLKPILLIPNLILTFIGLILILRTIASRGVSLVGQTVFLIIIFSSSPFIWWITTFTSYSNHLICFGLLLHSSILESRRSQSSLIGRAALMRSSAVLLNYQYIPILFMLGVLDATYKRRRLMYHRAWRGWVLPAMVCGLSILFLFFRAFFSGKHANPTEAALPSYEKSIYNFPSQLNELSTALEFLVGRYFDILQSYYFLDALNITKFNFIEAFLSILIVLLFIYFSLRFLDRILLLNLYTIVAATLLLHLIGIMPLSPTRHQLVMFAPFSLILACAIDRLFYKIVKEEIAFCILAIILSVLLIYQTLKIIDYTKFNPSLPIQSLRKAINDSGAQRLVLSPCDFEPLLYTDLRKRFNPIYRCGPKIVRQIPEDVLKIAVWSSFYPLDQTRAAMVVSDFSNHLWVFRSVPLQYFSADRKYSLFIGERVN